MWNKYYGPVHDKNLNDIDESQWLRLFEDIVHNHGLDAKAFNTMFAIINNIMSYAIHMGYISSNPVSSIKQHDLGLIKNVYNKVKTEGFTSKQAEKVMEWCFSSLADKGTSHIYPLLLLFQIMTGTRVGECCGLTWSDVDFDSRTVRFSKQTTRGIQFDPDSLKVTYRGKMDIDHMKGYESTRELTLSDDAVHVLEDVRKLNLESDKVFPIRYGTYNNKVKLAASYADCDPKLFHTHSLRVTFGTEVYNQCGDIAVTQNLLGHTTPAMTYRYIKDHEIKAKARQIMSKNLYSTPGQPPEEAK